APPKLVCSTLRCIRRFRPYNPRMDAPYISALAALAGSAIGGFTSLAASWLSQHVQFRAQRLAPEARRRRGLYGRFIEEASKMYADAFVRDVGEVDKMVKLYALAGKIRVAGSPNVVKSTDDVIRRIITEYQAPNKTFRDVIQILDKQEMNPLATF